MPETEPENGSADGLDCTDCQRSCQIGGLGDSSFGAGQFLHNRRGIFIKNHALSGQRGLFADPVKQIGIQLLLEILDLNCDGGLGISQDLSRL